MKTRTKQSLTVIMIVILAVAVYTGTVFAQTTSPSTTPTNMLQWMQERLGPEAWAQRVERMTQLHGADFVSQRLAFMAQQPSCPCTNGAGPGMQNGMMGQGMMQQQPNGTQNGMMGRGMGRPGMMGQGMMQQQPNGTQNGMMGRGMGQSGMMGQGVQSQGRSWGFHQPMAPGFWKNAPTPTPTPAQ